MGRSLRLVGGVGLFLLTAHVVVSHAAEGDKKELLGTWTITRYEYDGKPDKAMNGFSWTFTEDIIKNSGTKGVGWTYKIDPSATPAHIDIAFDPKKPKDMFHGIYELKGDTLRICVPINSVESRPKSIGKKWSVYTFQRKKS